MKQRPESSGTDRAMRDAVLAGDADAWRTWYDMYFDRLAAYARWRCAGLIDLADDVVQETWLAAVRRLSSFDPARASFFAWLCGIASNCARNAIRSRRRQGKPSRPLGSHEEPAAIEGDSTAVENAERVALALAALPDHYEAVLRSKYLDQMSVAAIASARNESPKAVESLLSRARQAFREVYESRTPEEATHE